MGLAVLVASGIATEALAVLVLLASSGDLVNAFPSGVAFVGIKKIIAMPWVVSDIGTSLATGSILVDDWEVAPTTIHSTSGISRGDVEAGTAGCESTALVSSGHCQADEHGYKQSELVHV